MRFKFDENLHSDAAVLFRQHGHDAATVVEQGLRGHDDTKVADVCRREQRTLVTLDLDFGDIRAYPPADYPGIIVLRIVDQSRPAVHRVLLQVLALFATEPLSGHLWIVDDSNVRIRGSAPP